MISMFEVRELVRRNPEEFVLSADENDIIDAETGLTLCSVEEMTETMRKKMHCDFTSIYYEHVSLQNVLVCNECGTVIFATEDEWYDPNLCCPTCGGYHCHFKYWTKEEIDNDPEKQKEIEGLKAYMKYMEESYLRRKARNGLYDWQLFNKTYYKKKHCYTIEITVNNITESKIKGLALKISVGDKDDNGISYIIKRWYTIPLGITALYTYWILPYSKKYPEKFRKYHFWQKKPKNSVT